MAPRISHGEWYSFPITMEAKAKIPKAMNTHPVIDRNLRRTGKYKFLKSFIFMPSKINYIQFSQIYRE